MENNKNIKTFEQFSENDHYEFKTLKVSEEELKNAVEGLIKETEGQGIWSGWSIHLRLNPETNEYETSDFLSQGTHFRDNNIDILSMESWSIAENNEEWEDYIFDAYDEINKTKIDRENNDAYELAKENEKVERLAYELCENDFDYSTIIDVEYEQAKMNLKMNGEQLGYDIEFID